MTSRLSTVLLLVVWPAVLAGQAPTDTVRLEPVVVTATRLPVPRDAVTATVTVITGTELERLGIRTVAEALRGVPGAAVVQTGSFGGQTSLFLRGGESDYVKVLLDGVPLNQPGGAYDFADLTTDNVERIEIVRGPVSVLYGSDAVAGVIQIFTRTGLGAAPRVTAAARAGTYGSTELAAEVSGGNALAYAFGVSRFGAEGLYPYNNDYRNTVVSGRVRFAPDDRTDGSLVYRYGDNVYHFPTDGAGQPVDSNQSSAERGPVLSLAVGRRLSPAVELRAVAALRETRLRFSDEPDSPGEDGSFHSRDLVRRASAGTLVNWRLREGTVLTAGVEYEDERQRGRSEFAASFGSFPDSIDVRRWNRAAYAQALAGVARPLSVQLGARFEDNSQFGRHGTYRAGLSYRLEGLTRLRASLGAGFKEPTFFENFARGFVRGNPDLRPERSTNWEAGIEHTVFGGRVSLAVTYFDQRFRDLIEFTFSPPPPDSVNYFNVAGASADGVEASVDVSLGRGVMASLHYTYLDTRVDDPGFDASPDAAFVPGRRLLRRPTHSATQHFAAPLGTRGTVAVTARFVGDRDDLDFSRPAGERRVTLHPYMRVNFAAWYELLRGSGAAPGLILTVRVEDLFDDDAQEIAGFRARGRTVFVGARIGLGR